MLTVVSSRSWQTLMFDKQPASFIRIVGTHNTANEVKTHFTVAVRLLSVSCFNASGNKTRRQSRISLCAMLSWRFLLTVSDCDLPAGVPLCSLWVSGPARHRGQGRKSWPELVWLRLRLPASTSPATFAHTEPAALPALLPLIVVLTVPPLRESSPPRWRVPRGRETSECHFAQPSSSRLHCYNAN